MFSFLSLLPTTDSANVYFVCTHTQNMKFVYCLVYRNNVILSGICHLPQWECECNYYYLYLVSFLYWCLCPSENVLLIYFNPKFCVLSLLCCIFMLLSATFTSSFLSLWTSLLFMLCICALVYVLHLHVFSSAHGFTVNSNKLALRELCVSSLVTLLLCFYINNSDFIYYLSYILFTA